MKKIMIFILIFALLANVVYAATWWTGTPNFVINETSHWDSVKVNTTTITDRYNQSANTLELDFPYADKDTNLVSYWRFSDSSSPTIDETGLANGAVTGAQINVSGKFGSGYNFSEIATNHYITVGTVSTYSFIQNSANFTVSFWWDGHNIDTQYFIGSTGTTVNKGFYMGTDGSHYVCAGLNGTSGQSAWSFTSTSYATAAGFQHVVCTGNTTHVMMYINGTLDTAIATVNTLPTGDSTNVMTIGKISTLTSSTTSGILDEVKIYETNLSTSEIQKIYNNELCCMII